MQFCAAPGCSVLVAKGRCAVHARARDAAAHDPRAVALYAAPRWRRLRAQVLAAAPLCVRCQAAGRVVLAVDVDHVRPHNGDLGRFYDRANLQGLCKPCHRRKTLEDARRPS